MITMIGIGYEKNGYSMSALEAALAADKIFLRTALSPAGKSFAAALTAKQAAFTTFDAAYESAGSFDALNAEIVSTLTNLQGHIAYCVDGDGSSDSSAECLFLHGTEIRVVAGAGTARMPSASCLNLSAYDLTGFGLQIDTRVSLNVYGIDNRLLAGQVKEALSAFYEDEAAVYFCGRSMPLTEIDRQNDKQYGLLTTVFVPAQTEIRRGKYCFGDLTRILARLTAPDGCPWDKAQTHESIRINLIEEAYEAVDAIDANDCDAMAEELGDVLLQALFHCDMAERLGEFTLSDVLTGLCAKLVGRHTHIFGADKAAGADEALVFWDKAKAQEKHYESLGDVLNRLPDGFPALLRAEKLLKKLKKAGYEYPGGNTLLEAVAALAERGKDAEIELNGEIGRIIRSFAAAEQAGTKFEW